MSDQVLAPVLIITYDRLEHLKKTISSLRDNILAEKTDLFVASDFQMSDSAGDIIKKVRDYLKSVEGFKSVTIFQREKNLGALANCLSALETISIDNDRFIIMEDDLITAPGFLTFMNQAFDKYGANVNVLSLTGYCPPIRIPLSYDYDAFFLKRMSAWGCGFMKDKYASVLTISQKEYDDFASNKKLRRAFVQGGGKDMLSMLKLVAYGSLEALDVQFMYTQFMRNQYTVYPTQSLVQNIGHDGTGTHCGKTDRFNVTLSDKTSFRFPEEHIVDSRIVKANLTFRNGSTFKYLRAQVALIFHRSIKRLLRILNP